MALTQSWECSNLVEVHAIQLLSLKTEIIDVYAAVMLLKMSAKMLFSIT